MHPLLLSSNYKLFYLIFTLVKLLDSYCGAICFSRRLSVSPNRASRAFPRTKITQIAEEGERSPVSETSPQRAFTRTPNRVGTTEPSTKRISSKRVSTRAQLVAGGPAAAGHANHHRGGGLTPTAARRKSTKSREESAAKMKSREESAAKVSLLSPRASKRDKRAMSLRSSKGGKRLSPMKEERERLGNAAVEVSSLFF